MKYQLLQINNFPYVFQLFTYPLLLILFLDLEFKNKNLKKMLSVLGNLTYSSYLIHLPIQITICLIFINTGKTIPVEEKEFFLFYISLVLFVSYFSFKYYESPIKNYLRQNM
jgi:peptidoglycan/LPS O-acetylase OafA/YrhL